MTERDGILLGTLEHLILLAVLALGTDAYGLEAMTAAWRDARANRRWRR